MQYRSYRRYLTALGFSFLALGAGAQQPEPSKADKPAPRAEQSQTPTDDVKAATPPPAHTVSVTDKPRAEPHKEHPVPEREKERNAFLEWFGKFITEIKITDALLTIFTGALAVYTYRLWRSTDKLWAAGERQLRVVEAQSRAHIAMTTKGVTFTPVPNNRPIIYVNVSALNAGGTPALRFGFAFNVRLLKWPLPDDYEIEWPSLGEYEERVGAVLPNQTITLTGGHGLTIDLERIARENIRLYIIGIARYEDAFGNRRETRFCVAAVQTFAFLNACLSAPASASPTALPELQFDSAARGNMAT